MTLRLEEQINAIVQEVRINTKKLERVEHRIQYKIKAGQDSGLAYKIRQKKRLLTQQERLTSQLAKLHEMEKNDGD